LLPSRADRELDGSVSTDQILELARRRSPLEIDARKPGQSDGWIEMEQFPALSAPSSVSARRT